jgi:hypothetical protein
MARLLIGISLPAGFFGLFVSHKLLSKSPLAEKRRKFVVGKRRFSVFSALVMCFALTVVSCGDGGGGAQSNGAGTEQLGGGETQPNGGEAQPNGGEAQPKWTGTEQLGVVGAYTYARGVAADSSGNVYVTGSTTGGLDGNTLTGTYDLFLIKYDSLGNKVFIKQLGVVGAYTYANGVATDLDGNVYVTGYTNGGLDGNTLAGKYDFFLTKYDSSGNRAFTKQLGVAGPTNTYATGVAADSGGNVYVTGYTNGGLDGNTLAGKYDFFLTKYDSSGNRVFTKQLGVAGPTNTYATGVAVDSGGNVYVTGSTNGGLDGNTLAGKYDLFLIKYDSSGNRVFTKQLGVAGATNTYATGVAVDSGGNAYVTGYTNGGLDGNTLTGIYDFFLTKYDSSGNEAFTKQLGVAGAETYANGVAVDPGSNAYVTGYTNGGLDGNTLTGTYDLFLTRYDSSGEKQ